MKEIKEGNGRKKREGIEHYIMIIFMNFFLKKKKAFECKLILCKAPTEIIIKRLNERYKNSTEKERVKHKKQVLSFIKCIITFHFIFILFQCAHTHHFNKIAKAIRKNLGELDARYINRIASRYDALANDGWFDFTLETHEHGAAESAARLLHFLRQAESGARTRP